MSFPLPLSSAWPGRAPEEVLNPGQPHYLEHVQSVVEAQHWLLAYQMPASGIVQRFGYAPDPILAPRPLCQETGGAFPADPHLVYVRTLFQYAQKLRFLSRCSSDQGGEIRYRVTPPVGAAVDTVQAVGMGANQEQADESAALGFGGLLCTIEIWLRVTGGGTYLELQGLAIACADLTVGDLP